MTAIIPEGLVVSPMVAFFDPDIPHRLSGTTLKDGQPVQRRVEVCKRSGGYIISTVSGSDGLFDLSHLPPQKLSEPYTVTCFDDATGDVSRSNAVIFDRVYQVNDAGNPPQV